jgi:hypothetical protein
MLGLAAQPTALFGLISNNAIFTSLIRNSPEKPLDIEIGKGRPAISR